MSNSRPSDSSPRTAQQQADLEERVRALRLPAPAKGAASSRLPWALMILLAGYIGWDSYLKHLRPNPTAEESTPATVSADTPDSNRTDKPSNKTPTSPTQRAASGDIVLDSKGHVVPAHEIRVSPKVGGMIVELFIEEGRRVKKDEILAVVEKIDFESDRDRAKAALMRAEALRDRADNRMREIERGFRPLEKQQSEAELAEAKTELKRLQADHARQTELHQKGVLTDKDFEDTTARYQGTQQRVRRLEAALALMLEGEREERRAMARNDWQQTEADVVQARAELAKSQWRLDNCTIRAPINGTVLKKNAEIFNIVNPIAPQGSYSLCDMADLSDLEVELNIGERDVSVIFPGQRCQVRADAYPDRIYEAKVDRLMPIADRSKASIPVRVKVQVPNEEEGVYLKPEMGVNVTFFKAPSAPVDTDPKK